MRRPPGMRARVATGRMRVHPVAPHRAAARRMPSSPACDRDPSQRRATDPAPGWTTLSHARRCKEALTPAAGSAGMRRGGCCPKPRAAGLSARWRRSAPGMTPAPHRGDPGPWRQGSPMGAPARAPRHTGRGALGQQRARPGRGLPRRRFSSGCATALGANGDRRELRVVRHAERAAVIHEHPSNDCGERHQRGDENATDAKRGGQGLDSFHGRIPPPMGGRNFLRCPYRRFGTKALGVGGVVQEIRVTAASPAPAVPACRFPRRPCLVCFFAARQADRNPSRRPSTAKAGTAAFRSRPGARECCGNSPAEDVRGAEAPSHAPVVPTPSRGALRRFPRSSA